MNKLKIEYISLASVISAIAVVYIHAMSISRRFNLTGSEFTWDLDLMLVFAVPIFFMISGAMLLDFNKRYDLKTYLTKRISKTLIPFLIWSIFGLLFYVYYLNIVDLNNLTYIFKGLFVTADLIPPYWFFIPLFICYFLVYPIFTRFSDNQRLFKYFILIFFISHILIYYFVGVRYRILGYISLTFMGFYIHKFNISKKLQNIIYILAILSLIIGLIGKTYPQIPTCELLNHYWSNASLDSLLYSLGLFTLIKYKLVKIMEHEKFKNIIFFLNDYIFGIYLIHWYILLILIKAFQITDILIYLIICPILTIVLCVIFIYFIRQIPILKKILPK